ncbi:MAG: hypothetical protein II849_00925 [Bacteroidales bacterium]|nr:hypothetical protein [Bacteroidales bacterium]
MKHFLMLLTPVVLLLAGCTSVQPAATATCNCQRTVRVPDKAFRTWLIDNGLAVRAHGKYLRATAEGCATTELECYNQGIGSLDGIELFPQLEQLTCSDNPVTNLDVNALPRLQRLYGINLPLERFDADSCHDLHVIQLSHTHLDTLDLTPFPHLESLLCIYSPLRAIDLAPCPNLRTLYIRFTHIQEVDLTPCPDFWQLHALDTPLRTVTVTPGQYTSETLKVSIEDSVNIVVKR